MALLRSALDTASPAFAANDAALRDMVDDLRARTHAVSERGAAGDELSLIHI